MVGSMYENFCCSEIMIILIKIRFPYVHNLFLQMKFVEPFLNEFFHSLTIITSFLLHFHSFTWNEFGCRYYCALRSTKHKQFMNNASHAWTSKRCKEISRMEMLVFVNKSKRMAQSSATSFQPLIQLTRFVKCYHTMEGQSVREE